MRTLFDDLNSQNRAIDSRYFAGIDLGTTNSAISIVDTKKLEGGNLVDAIEVVQLKQPLSYTNFFSPLLPSFVAEIDATKGRWLVGTGAKERRRLASSIRGFNIFYSTKTEMGLGRDPFYPQARSKDVDCPYKVAAKVLRTLVDGATEEFGPSACKNMVVTVPASFQIGARQDTFAAASIAGIKLGERSLLDEPNAALLYYLSKPSNELLEGLRGKARVLVLDFGGGTCDVSILQIQPATKGKGLNLSNLAISRYERLGGDNIDRAIVEDLLLPALFSQNKVAALDFGWNTKQNKMLPQLLDVAEALRIGVCSEYRTQLGLSTPEKVDKDTIKATQPSVRVFATKVDSPTTKEPLQFLLQSPSLAFRDLERILEPFLDTGVPYHGTPDEGMRTSIFAPIGDALTRADLKPAAIDDVLLAGGCSMIPQVRHALAAFFKNARILRFSDDMDTLLAVSKGAAIHSFCLHGMGWPALLPIAQETIGVITRGGEFNSLIPAGTELPHPLNEEPKLFEKLTVPKDGMESIEIVLAADSPSKLIGTVEIMLPKTVKRGDQVELSYVLDSNKLLRVQVALPKHPGARAHAQFENPLCSTRFENETQREILQLEQAVSEAISQRRAADVTHQMEELARKYLALSRHERALNWARSAMQIAGGPDLDMLNLMGICYLRMGSFDRAEKAFAEGTRLEPGADSLHFNLSLVLPRMGRDEEALQAVNKATELDRTEGAYRAHKGDILLRLGRAEEAQAEFKAAAPLLDPFVRSSPFHRGWRMTVAERLGDMKTMQRLRELAKIRPEQDLGYDPEKLPDLRGETNGEEGQESHEDEEEIE